MSMKLNLVDHLLAMGCKLQDLGRDQDAQHVFHRLASLNELPANIIEETQVRLAEIHLKKREFHRARRHLTAALVQHPEHARCHYLLATALDSDERGDSGEAADHYRKSLELDANQPLCLGEFGLLALRLGQSEEGLQALRRAAELAPTDPEVVGNLVEGLRQEGLLDEARTVLRCALFRNAGNRRFRKLKDDFEFQVLRQEQQAARYLKREGRTPEDGPVLLPFIRPAPDTRPAGLRSKTVRRDGTVPSAAPHFPRLNRWSDQRHAQ